MGKKVKVRLNANLVIGGVARGIGAIVEIPEEDIKRYGDDITVLEEPKKKKGSKTKAVKEAPADKMIKGEADK